MAKPKLTWQVPRWAYTRRMWLQLGQILNVASLTRIVIASAISSAVIIAAFKLAVPQLVLPNLWPMLFVLPGIVLGLVAQFGVLTLIRPTVVIRADRITQQHGQEYEIIDPKTVTAAFLVFHPEDRIRLKICYTRKSKGRTLVTGVPPEVDLDCLSGMLPVQPVIRDARSRSIRRQDPKSPTITAGP